MRIRVALTSTLAAGLLLTAAGTATAQEYDDEPFQPGPDYEPFQPGPDYEPFQPGYAPGTADLVDDRLGPVVTRLLGGLFR